MIPEYTIRESKRAKHVGIKISPRDGVVVVIPVGYNRKKIPKIIEKKKDWIAKNYNKLAGLREDIANLASSDLPDTIELNAVDEIWEVEYRLTTAKTAKFKEQGDIGTNNLVIYGNIKNKALCRAALKKWLKEKAENHLVPWLEEMSCELELPINKVTIRSQKERWASCSSRKNISVNQKLLFIPEELVSYVFIHELCHTKQMNHGKKFWQLVAQFEPDYKKFEKMTRNSAWYKHIPAWSEI